MTKPFLPPPFTVGVPSRATPAPSSSFATPAVPPTRETASHARPDGRRPSSQHGGHSGETPRAGGDSTDVRADEVAILYRKVTALLGERAEAEARIERALNESAAADEQVGQMLATMASVEGRMRAAQKEAAQSDERARAAERRVTELSALVAKLRAVEIEGDARVAAAEARAEERARETTRVRSIVDSSLRDAEAARAAADQLRAELAAAGERYDALAATLARHLEERDTMQSVIDGLEGIGEERDEALARVELAEVHVRNARSELNKARELALSGENRLEGDLRERVAEIDKLAGELAEARNKAGALEKEIASTQRSLEEQVAATRAAEQTLAARDAGAREARRDQAELEQEIASARAERDGLAARAAEQELRAAALGKELEEVRTVLDATRTKLKTLAIEREMADGLAEQTRLAHEAEAKRLRDEAAQASARGAEAMALAEQFRSEMTAARRERDGATALALRAKRDLEIFRSRADPLRTEFRSAVDDASRGLADLEKRELEVTRLRSSAINSTRELLDRAVAVEHALAAMLNEMDKASVRSSASPPTPRVSVAPGTAAGPGSSPPSSSPVTAKMGEAPTPAATPPAPKSKRTKSIG